MTRFHTRAWTVLTVVACTVPLRAQETEKPKNQTVPVALLPFREVGKETKDIGAKVGDLLFARLIANPDMFLVDRQDIDKLQREGQLNLSGLVNSDQATRLGHLTG